MSGFFGCVSRNECVNDVFYGLRPAVAGLVGAAGFQAVYPCLIRLSGSFDVASLLSAVQWKGIILFAVLYFLIKKYKKHPLVYIAASAVVGVVFGFAG